MITHWLEIAGLPCGWEQLEGELLIRLQAARLEFEYAPAEEKDRAGERYRRALDRFSALVLDRRLPAERDSLSFSD